jgi:integrase
MLKAMRSDVTQAGKQKVLVVASEEGEEIEGISRRTKSGKLRTIPLNDGALVALERLGKKRLVDFSRGGLDHAWERTRKGANVTGGVHTLRHTFCSHLVMAGVPLRTVQVLAGHSSIAITERYAHLAPGATLDAVMTISL